MMEETGVPNDGTISKVGMYDISGWLRDNPLQEWTALHGDDEKDGDETGFHLVQNDGETSRLFSTNAVNMVADGLYHVGFEIECGRLLNEDGNKHVSLERAAYWLNELLEDDLAAGTLASDEVVDVAFVFGEDGAHLYFDGAKVDTEMDFTGGITENT